MNAPDMSADTPASPVKEVVPKAKVAFDPDATMIIDKRGKIRTHEDADYRSVEVWAAKIRNRLSRLQGLKETPEGQEFVRAVTSYVRTKDASAEHDERILRAFELAHLSYENLKKSRGALTRPNSTNLAERIGNEIAGAYRIHSAELLDIEMLKKHQTEAYESWKEHPKDSDIRRTRDQADELVFGYEAYVDSFLKRSMDNAGYLVLSNIRRLFQHLWGIAKSEKLKSGKLDPVPDSNLGSVFVGFESDKGPAPIKTPQSVKNGFGDRIMSVLSSQFGSLFSKRS